MDRKLNIAAALVLIAVVGMAGAGCTSAEYAGGDSVEASYGRALATQPALIQREQDRLALSGQLPWYAGRNDAELSVSAGVKSPTVKTSVTWTVDRQRISGGRVFDHYHTTTYRQHIVESIE